MSATVMTSVSSPLRIADISVGPGDGYLGLTLCPGKKDLSRGWNRDLRTDVAAIRDWGASAVVTLIEMHEFGLLSIETLEDEVRNQGMDWLHLPIRDVDIPDARFEHAWKASGPLIHQRLDAAQRILIHCRGGSGRTGLVAALVLVERGMEPWAAIGRVRGTRRHAIETTEKNDYVLACGSISNVREPRLGKPSP